MTLRHLRIFVAVCENGGVTAAAERLYLSQPSVSLAIRELEEHYGVRLFDRISRRLDLTEAGRRFLEYASHIVSMFGELESEARDWEANGALRVGASITIGNCLLPGLVRQFRELRPQVKVRALVENSEAVEMRVLRNELDFALIEGRAHSPQLVQQPFSEDRLVLLCGPQHPLHDRKRVRLEELVEHDFILREKGSAGREIFDSILVLHGIELEPVWESVSTQAIVRAVEAGLGLSVLPRRMVEADLAAGRVCELPLADASLSRQFLLIYHKNKYLTAPMQEFMALAANPLRFRGNPAYNKEERIRR